MPDFLALFDQLKPNIVSFTFLSHYDSSGPCFLQTDWSVNAFGSILLQPNAFPKSLAALEHLSHTGECKFDFAGCTTSTNRFGIRWCTEYEQHLPLVVGEAAFGRLAIGQDRKSLWGSGFYCVTLGTGTAVCCFCFGRGQAIMSANLVRLPWEISFPLPPFLPVPPLVNPQPACLLDT